MFYILGNVLNIYMWICIVRIFLSWIPQLLMNPIGRFLSDACDPYLLIFRRFRFTQIGSLDFSPIIALGVLSLLKEICFSIYLQGRFSFVGLLIILLSSIWQILSFVLNLILLLALLRFILEFSYKYRSSFFCVFIDRIFSGLKHFIMKYIFKYNWQKEKWSYFLIFLFVLLIRFAVWLAFFTIQLCFCRLF